MHWSITMEALISRNAGGISQFVWISRCVKLRKSWRWKQSTISSKFSRMTAFKMDPALTMKWIKSRSRVYPCIMRFQVYRTSRCQLCRNIIPIIGPDKWAFHHCKPSTLFQWRIRHPLTFQVPWTSIWISIFVVYVRDYSKPAFNCIVSIPLEWLDRQDDLSWYHKDILRYDQISH